MIPDTANHMEGVGEGELLSGSFVFEDGSKYDGEYSESDSKKTRNGKVTLTK